MKKFWIHNKWYDSVFFLSPPFLVLVFIVFFQDKIVIYQEEYPFYVWLFLIVFIDVAHVYATLFKTYFNPIECKKHRDNLVKIPLLCFIIGFVLYRLGANIFWSVMAYIAVFHFVRQQYGFLRLYQKNEIVLNYKIENLAIYNATIFPMLYWFLSPKKEFNWFMENEFLKYENPFLLKISFWIYFIIIGVYILYLIKKFVKYREFNYPKVLLILGTYLSWYFGIVYYNNDLIFTVLNVVSHGIPYMALVYINQKNESHSNFIPRLSTLLGTVFYMVIILFIAFSEEFLWEIIVWNENISTESFSQFKNWHLLLVPLLMVPQFTHYILDGIIWKHRK